MCSWPRLYALVTPHPPPVRGPPPERGVGGADRWRAAARGLMVASMSAAPPTTASTGLAVALPDRRHQRGDRRAPRESTPSGSSHAPGSHERRIARARRAPLRTRRRAPAAEALADAGVDPAELDLVLVATTYRRRADAGRRAAGRRARSAPTGAGAIDIDAACTGFLSALSLAAAQIESGRAGHVLVIGADLMSRVTDPDDRRTAALFGDGAGARARARRRRRPAIGPIVLRSDGAQRRPARDPARDATSSRCRATRPSSTRSTGCREATLRGARRRPASSSTTSTCSSTTRPTRGILARGRRAARPRRRRGSSTASPLGNTSAASIPLALDEARRDGRLRDGLARPARRLRRRASPGARRVIEWGTRHRATRRAARAARWSPAPRAGSAPRPRTRWPPTAGRCRQLPQRRGGREAVVAADRRPRARRPRRSSGRRRRCRRDRQRCSSPATDGPVLVLVNNAGMRRRRPLAAARRRGLGAA